uniref:glucuronosyltransferase n=1 Tax=Globodera pallida TaxID=36090 RepID=A0A183C1D8_GLOPA
MTSARSASSTPPSTNPSVSTPSKAIGVAMTPSATYAIVVGLVLVRTPPKLRILIITTRIPITETHYVLHRKMAELLAADAENVEKVVLLVAKTDCAEPTEVPRQFDGRFVVWNRMTFGSTEFENVAECHKIVDQFERDLQQQPKLWEYNATRFLPKPDKPVMGNLEFLKTHQKLIQQLQQFKFNVGIMETNPGELALSLLGTFPTIKKFVGSQSTSPTIAHWKYFGYDKIVGAMPGRDLANLGDHKFATESAINENPNYFRKRNENLYIKPIESAGKLLHQIYLNAIDQGILSKAIFEDFVMHEKFTEWEMKQRMDLYFTNIQPFLDFPIVEQEIERERNNTHQNRVNFIGGITMSKDKVPNLNPDTKQIYESAKDGVVLLSFGSAVEMDDGDEHAVSVKNIVVDVFKQYPQNSKTFSANSINEAVKFGVPIILFPFFGDQFNCAEALAARKVAKVLDIRSKTLKKDFAEALDEMFNKYSAYKQRMNELSKKMNSVEPAKEFVEKFRQLRKNGVVLLSFGSAVEMNDGDEHAVSVMNIVVDVFKQYPQMNLIIKWGKRPPTGTVEQYNKLSENVYAKSWLEQAAILGGGLKLFITHGGLNSINEAVKFGVPIILFPFFGDQYNNAEALAAREVAKVLDIRSETLKKDFAEALDEMFNKYSAYKQRMNELSKKMNSVEPGKEFVEKFRQLRNSL